MTGDTQVPEGLQNQFRKAALNRHKIGLLRSHPEAGLTIEDTDSLEQALFLSGLSYAQWSTVSVALQSYESLAEHHRFGSPICGICPTLKVTEQDEIDLHRSGLQADLLAILAF